MSAYKGKITYGRYEISYRLERRDRRTLEIAVEPDKSVMLAAPIDAPLEIVEERLKKRAAWVRRQQLFFDQFHPQTPPRRYVSGETHLYLGRQYRLSIVRHIQEGVKLVRGYLFIQSHKPECRATVQRLLEEWYRGRAQIKFSQRLNECLGRFPDRELVEPSILKTRKLKYRWGSMSANNILTLNARLIQAPLDGIDYVITHELCHIVHPNHGLHFFELLDRVMPDWERRKLRLERLLA